MSACRGCGKPIVWATTPQGGRIPLDTGAPIYIVQGNDSGGFGASLHTAAERREELAAGEPIFAVSHFATCPQANEFSGSKK